MSRRGIPQEFQSCISDDGTRITLAGRGLTEIPGWLGKLPAVATLNLSRNRLAALPEWLVQFKTVTELDLSANRLVSLPESLGELKALTRLRISSNQLLTLPKSIGGLTKLIELDLARNQLTDLPASIGGLASLTRLSLRVNELAILPETMGRLTAVSRILLDHNKLTDLPSWLEQLTALTELSLLDNRLTSLPGSIGQLTGLTTLNLTSNQLTGLPESIGQLTGLTELDMAQNQLTSLPESIGQLTGLTTLNLTSNQLTSLPWQLADLLSDGLHLELTRNALGDPLPELVRRGADALAVYLRSLEDATIHYEAKVLMVGEGNVGKTSLVAALRSEPFIEGRPTTHGIEISTLAFNHPTIDLAMMLRAWDFGGQEVYRVTHQFFFSHRALYVVVWNARNGHEQDDVEGWLRRIRLRVSGDAHAIVAATHCEDRLPELDYRNLEHIFPGMLAGSFNVDSRTEIGLPELRAAIAQQAAGLPHMGERISLRWLAVRKEIIARAAAEPQIMYEEFADVCERHGLRGQEAVTLAELMHDLGQIIYYGDDEGLKDVVVLNPEWLTKAISYVLEDKQTKEMGGFSITHVLRRSGRNEQRGLSIQSVIIHTFYG